MENSYGVLSRADADKKREVKEENRRKTKETRKNRVKEVREKSKAKPKTLDRKEFLEVQNKKKTTEGYKEQLDASIVREMSFATKISLVKSIADEIIMDADKKFRKINDLLLFTEDPKSIDVVLKAVQQLCRVFVDIIPDYRIREIKDKEAEEKEKGANKGVKISKEVTQLRNYEGFLLESYKKYLAILEQLSKIKPGQLVHKTKIED
jgi:hypothetical protein